MGKTDPKIALVHDWMAVSGGGETAVLKPVSEIYPNAPLFTSIYNPERYPWLKGRDVRTSYADRLPLSKTKHYVWATLMPSIYGHFDTREFDVLLSDSHSFAHYIPKKPGALHICYYLTPARSLWAPEIDPRARDGRLAFLKKALAKRMKVWDLEASKNPDVVMAISHTTADRIKMAYGRDVDHVIYPAVDTEAWGDVARTGDDGGFLMWGRLIAYKRFDLAIQATKLTGDTLHIVGDGPYREELERLAAGQGHVHFHGRLPDEELRKIMSRVQGVLFPCYEDFGVVPVEAMAAGIPVVAYRVGGAAETVKEAYGAIFDELTPESLADGIRALKAKTYDPGALKEHASQFSVARFKREYKAAIDLEIEKHF